VPRVAITCPVVVFTIVALRYGQMLRVTLEFPDIKVKSPVQFPFKREFNKDGPLNGEAEGLGDFEANSAPTVISTLQISGVVKESTTTHPDVSASPDIREGTEPQKK